LVQKELIASEKPTSVASIQEVFEDSKKIERPVKFVKSKFEKKGRSVL
jgi:hypothetical protein